MSAIAGIHHFEEQPIPAEHSVKLMRGLQHYPYDDVQTWHEDDIFLGCHAQWITPESVGEQLPYFDQQRQLVITADAIIDNREELFDSLGVQYPDRNMPDSHLILLAYQKWGYEAPKYLIGDFVFMIWDKRKHLLFGARDFSGSRTLYFVRKQYRFAFCSSIQPLLLLPYVKNDINEQWVAEFIAIPHMLDSLDASATVYKDVGQIPPSHSITIVDGRIKLVRYCTLMPPKQLKLKSDQEYVEAFKDVFQRAVQCRLRTHRQVGATLSGGLDSGAVVGFAARALAGKGKPLYTYSYIPTKDFADWSPRYRIADESPFIKSTVQKVGNIRDHYVSFEELSPFSEIDNWLDIMESPYKFFENSFWLRGICEQASQQGIKVMLNGARGNFTVSWGPALEYYAALLKNLKWLSLGREVSAYSKNVGAKALRVMSIVAQMAYPPLHRLLRSKEPFQFPVYINQRLAQNTGVFEKLDRFGIQLKDDLEDIFLMRKRFFEEVFYMNSSSTAEAKLSLRYSLCHRDPTFDLRVVRFCLSIPEEQGVQKGLDRALIRRATEGILPDQVRLNQRSRGIQGVDWVHRMIPSWNLFLAEFQQLVKDPIVADYFNLAVVKETLEQIKNGPRPKYAMDPHYRLSMRCLIIYRFIKKVLERR